MTPEQWRRARDLFEQAVEMVPTEAAAWLAREESDAAIVAEVTSLLKNHTGAGAFLAAAFSGPLADLLAEEPTFEAGARLGGYEIQKEIGRGGMGRVYLATDVRLGRRVALKVLAPRFVRDEAQRERLRREARAAASLSHPGICTIYALEEIDEQVVIAAEYIDGHPLRTEIAAGQRPSPRELLDAARELSAALGAAHARGITHRDFKPENVMRATNGHLKILDFGLALVEPQAGVLDAARMTTPGTLVGTPLYMAPEQLNNGTIDVRTDLFALGVVLYEFATGIHPFEATSGMGLAARILETEPRPISTVRADIPRQVAFVIHRCLRKSQAERFATAGDVALALASDDLRPTGPGNVGWWRNHMAFAIAVYFVAAAVGWLVKEWDHGFAEEVFVFIGMAATVGGVLRGHLMFAERTHDLRAFMRELQRSARVLMAVDLAVAAALVLEGLWVSQQRSVAGVLIIGLGLYVALARLVLERMTTDAAFGSANGTDK